MRTTIRHKCCFRQFALVGTNYAANYAMLYCHRLLSTYSHGILELLWQYVWNVIPRMTIKPLLQPLLVQIVTYNRQAITSQSTAKDLWQPQQQQCRKYWHSTNIIKEEIISHYYYWAKSHLAAHVIPPIATNLSTAWSVCLCVICPSHSCPVLKPFDGFRRRLAGTLVWVQWHIVLGKGRFGR